MRNDGFQSRFEEFFNCQRTHVWRVCRSVLYSEADAADAFQEAWVRFLVETRRRSEALDDPAAVALLLRCAAREAGKMRMRRWRRSQREVREEAINTLAAPDGSPAAALAEREATAKVLHCLDGLPERYALPLRLYYLAGLKHREIAEVLGVSVNTVSTRLARGTDRLRKRLQRAGIRGPESVLLTAGGLIAASAPPAISAAKVSTLAASAGSGAFLASLSGATAMKIGLGGAAAVIATAVGLAVLSPDENRATANMPEPPRDSQAEGTTTVPEPAATPGTAGGEAAPPAQQNAVPDTPSPTPAPTIAASRLPEVVEARFIAPDDAASRIRARDLYEHLKVEGMGAFPAPEEEDAVKPLIAELMGTWPFPGRMEGFEPLGLEHMPPSPGSIERTPVNPYGFRERVEQEVDGQRVVTDLSVQGAVSTRLVREGGDIIQAVGATMPYRVVLEGGRQALGRWRTNAELVLPGDSPALPFAAVAHGEISRGIAALGGTSPGRTGPDPAAWGTAAVYMLEDGTPGAEPVAHWEFPIYPGMTLAGFTGREHPHLADFTTEVDGRERRVFSISNIGAGMSVTLEPDNRATGEWSVRVDFDHIVVIPRPGGNPPEVWQRNSVVWEDTITSTRGTRTMTAGPDVIRSVFTRAAGVMPTGEPEEHHYELRISVE